MVKLKKKIKSGGEQAIRSARDFGIPQRFSFEEVAMGDLRQLTELVNIDELNIEFQKRTNILKHLSVNHAIHYLFPKIEAFEKSNYNKLVQSINSSAPDAGQQFVINQIAQRLKHINVWMKRFILANGVELTWHVPKFIYLPNWDGLPIPGKEDMHIVCPFFISEKFRTEPALINREKYLLAKIDLQNSPFIQSQCSDIYVKNLAMALQNRIENNESIKGASLILSGIPSKELLRWFYGTLVGKESKSTDQSPIPDVEIIYAIAVIKKSILSDKQYLFSLKPSRTFYRLKKQNNRIEETIYAKMDQTYRAERIRMVIDELIIEADVKKMESNYASFIKAFWQEFNTNLMPRPYQTLELPTEDDLLKSPDILQADLRLRIARPHIIITQNVIDRARSVMSSERTEGYYYLDWSHIIDDEVGEKRYDREYILLSSLTPAVLDESNYYGVFSRSQSYLSLRNKTKDSPTLIICASTASGGIKRPKALNSKKSACEPLLEYILFNMGLIYSQLKELKPDDIEVSCNAIILRCFPNYMGRIKAFVDTVLKNKTDGKKEGTKDDFLFSSLIADMDSILVSHAFDREKFNLFFSELDKKISFARISSSQISPFDLENTLVLELMKIPLFDHVSLDDLAVLLKDNPAKYLSLSPEMINYQKFHAIQENLRYDSSRKVLVFFDIRWERENLVQYIYTIMPDHTIRIALDPLHEKNRPTHSELSNGAPVLAAGELIFRRNADGWELITINNGSGHYRPPPVSLKVAREYIPLVVLINNIKCDQVLYCSSLRADMAVGSGIDKISTIDAASESSSPEKLIAQIGYFSMPQKSNINNHDVKMTVEEKEKYEAEEALELSSKIEYK